MKLSHIIYEASQYTNKRRRRSLLAYRNLLTHIYYFYERRYRETLSGKHCYRLLRIVATQENLSAVACNDVRALHCAELRTHAYDEQARRERRREAVTAACLRIGIIKREETREGLLAEAVAEIPMTIVATEV